MSAVTAIVLAAILAIIGVLHFCWAAEIYWPFRSREELVRKVLSGTDVPSAAATAVVAVLLVIAGYLALAVRWQALRFVPDWCYEWGIWGLAAVLFLRAVVDPLMTRDGHAEYKRLNLRVYSPLCLVLTALAVVTALA